VLKPPEMRRLDTEQPVEDSPDRRISSWTGGAAVGSDVLSPSRSSSDVAASEDDFWPPPRETLHRTTLNIISIHNLPKRRERRPRFDGRRGKCHRYHPQLSGTPAPPDTTEPSKPVITITLHPIGGVCAVDKQLPVILAQNADTELALPPANEGLQATFNQPVHCIAAEPQATLLRIAVTDGRQEVAYETAVLGRLRPGFRVFQMRAPRGTRIELCVLLVQISAYFEANTWLTPRQMRLRGSMLEQQKSDLEVEVARRLQQQQEKDAIAIEGLNHENKKLKLLITKLSSKMKDGEYEDKS